MDQGRGSDVGNEDLDDEGGVHICEKCNLNEEIGAVVDSHIGDWIGHDGGGQQGWEDKLGSVKSRRLRTVSISQLNKETNM